MTSGFPSQEARPLKKARLGPWGPDVYPQDPKQREDELTPTSVKHGFSNVPSIKDEYDSAKSYNISNEKIRNHLITNLENTEKNIQAFFESIIAKKQEINTFSDQGKKKLQINTKDNFWHFRTKQATDTWFKDLASNKPLTHLAKRVPIFNIAKKEDIFSTLIEYNIPLIRATWFIKMTNAYHTAIQENTKQRRRPASDPFIDWSQAVCKFLKEHLMKIIEYYQGSSSTTSFLTAGSTAPVVEIDITMRHWNYCCQLARHMYEEGLLDRHDFLGWLMDQLEKNKITDDTVLKIVLAQILGYTSEFVQSQYMSRRLAHFGCKKLSHMLAESGCSSPRTQSPMLTGGTNGNVTSASANQNGPNSLSAAFVEYTNCPQHRSVLLSLCAILQAIAIRCPGALVWHNLGEGKGNHMLAGSPLDLLNCAPSSLPMPPGVDNQQIRGQLRAAERQVILRGRAAELRWSSDKCEQSSSGLIISKVLQVLEALDKHNFDKVESNGSLESLYHKVFRASQVKDNNESVQIGDNPIVNLLCEWAVSTQRSGDNRAIVVAKLIEKRQNEITAEKFAENDMGDERESMGSDVMAPLGVPPFQSLLMSFLDNRAPVLDDNPTVENKQMFANLILLFCELIRHDVFSHDAYMCTLISRGDLLHTTPVVKISTANTTADHMDLSSVKSEGVKQEIQDEMKMELEIQYTGFDIFAFKDDVKHSPGDPGSVKSAIDQPPSVSALTPADASSLGQSQAHTPGMARTPGGPLTPGQAHTPAAGQAHTPGAARTPGAPHTPGTAHTPGMAHTPIASTPMAHTPGMAHTPVSSVPPPHGEFKHPQHDVSPKGPSRHLIYATHFPIPQDDYSSHECNQRMITLFGVGKARDEAKHVVKKITKEIMKLFGKKNSIDTSSGDVSKGKKKKEKEREKDTDSSASFESTFNKFQKLSYYDQHSVTQTCAVTGANSVTEVINSFATQSSMYLPLVENISYLFDLMEYSYNISGLLEFVIQLLKELPDVENQLIMRSANLVGSYTVNLCLNIVGVLRKYHAYILVSQEQTASAFECLCKVVKHVGNPSDCTSAERCILAYLYDLYTSCSFLKNKYSEMFSGACAKVKSTLYAPINPSKSNLLWEPTFLQDLIENPKGKLDPHLIRQLNESAANRYSFVCSAILHVCNCQSMDKLNDISILCAELTACCNSLSSEWLGVLHALCFSSNHSCGFIDVLTQVDVGDLSIHDSLAVFTAILIARNCFSLQDLVVHVAMHSLMVLCGSGNERDTDAEQGARLTCHLLLRMFQSNSTLPGHAPDTKNGLAIKSSCDRHLLEAAHSSIRVDAVIAVLKALLMLGDSCFSDKHSPVAKKDSNDIIATMMSSLDDEIGFDCKSKSGLERAGLSEYAQHTLKEICSQEWVREKFLKETESLFTTDHLLDPLFKHQLAQQLVQMLCYPGGVPSSFFLDDEDDDDEPSTRRDITRILQSMDPWSLRVSWLELQLMIKQATASEMTNLLENIAKATIEVFQNQTEKQINGSASSPTTSISWHELDSVWLVAPLISKLNSSVQGKVLKAAGQVLETGNNFWSAKNSKDKERHLQKSTSLLGHQPFLCLVLTCLRGQDEQREGLLNSLHEQLEKFVSNAKEQLENSIPTDEKLKFVMQEALQLRLSLVGGMFDTIQRNNTLTQDWCVLLTQLVSHGVVDISNNSELFTIVEDMLSVLIHGTLVSTNSEKGEEKRFYTHLIRKLKRELGEKRSLSIDHIRQLLPIPKHHCEVITVESKGDSRHKISGKQKVSPWEILEGHKNPAPLSLSWFGAVKMERRPLKYEEQHRLLLHHSHNLKKPASYFLDAPPLPPEDLEPPQEKPEFMALPNLTLELEEKPPETVVETNKPPEPKQTKTTKRGRRRQPRINTPGPTTYPMGGGPMQNMGFHRQEIYSSPTGGWSYGQNPNQPPNFSGQYPQQLPPGGPKFQVPPHPISQSKMALNNYLRQRQPGNAGFPSMGPSGNTIDTGRSNAMAQRNYMLRNSIVSRQRSQMGTHMRDDNLYSQSTGAMASGGSNFGSGMNSQGMGQFGNNFAGNMGQQQPMGMETSSTSGGMMNQGYTQFNNSGNNMPMPAMAQPSNFMGQQNTPQQQFSGSSRGFSGMSNMGAGMQPSNMNMGRGMGGNNMGGGSMTGGSMSSNMAGYSSMAPQAATPQTGYNMQGMSSAGRMHPLQRQQMMNMHQQQGGHNPQMQQPQQAGPSTNILSQLQRQMSGGGAPQQPQNPHYNNYQGY